MKNSFKYLNKVEKNALEQFKKLLQESLGKCLIKIEVFGSKIRGNYSETSDIDILVIVKDRTIDVMDKVAEITANLNIEYDLAISPVVFSEYEYTMNIDMVSPFSLSVESEGVKL